MTIHGSGTPIYASEIQAEFGGGNPFYISNYYAGGPYVPAGTVGQFGAVPSSGAISLWHFYGASNRMIITFGLGNAATGDSGFVEGAYGSLTPQAGGAGYPFGSERIILFAWWNGSPDRVYLDVAGSWPRNQFTNVDMPGKGGYNSATSSIYAIQGGYTRWAWNTSVNPFGPIGGTSQVNFT